MSGWCRITWLHPQSSVRGVVLVESGGVQGESYPPLQSVACLELGLQTIPVTSPDHAARYITEMVGERIPLPV